MEKYLKTRLYLKCHRIAFCTDDLMPIDCLDILKENYPTYRLEKIKPERLEKMIHYMMQTHTESSAYSNDIKQLVQDYCNDF